MRIILTGIICLMLSSIPARAQQRLVRILVSSPYIEHELYQPIGDVVAGTIIRELKRSGGVEVLDRIESEQIIQAEGGTGWIGSREQAAMIGEQMNADIVIYTTLVRHYDVFMYSLSFYQVRTDVIQRVLNGTFKVTDSPSEIGRVFTTQMAKLTRYIPLPSELDDPGSTLRLAEVDPDNLPSTHVIENLPVGTQFGLIERVLTYYRVFPTETDYFRLARGAQVVRLKRNDEVFDADLSERFNLYNSYGDFAIRQGMQAYFIDHCSTKAVNLLIANGIPVFYGDDLLIGYHNLMADGFCLFQTAGEQYFDAADMTYHDRIVVMIILPYPGRPGGVSREYLEVALARFENEWEETPELVEITEGLLDF